MEIKKLTLGEVVVKNVDKVRLEQLTGDSAYIGLYADTGIAILVYFKVRADGSLKVWMETYQEGDNPDVK